MKCLAINGSPRKNGNTELLLREVLKPLQKQGISTELLSLSGKTIQPCTACGVCAEDKGRCILKDDFAGILEKIKATDALILGSPVYFGAATPNIVALMNRAGYIARVGDNFFNRKVGAAVVAARRAGKTFTFTQLNLYFLILGMIVPGSSYWNVGIGREKGDVNADDEGMETMGQLGENIAWLLNKVRE